MNDYSKMLKALLEGLRIAKSSLDHSPQQQGAYIIWLDRNPPICLKVGIAGPRTGKGLRERLKYHFSSNIDNSILARHLAADLTSEWAQRYDLRSQDERQRFLEAECFIQAIKLPDLSRNELRQFEDFLERRLKPKYQGKVRDE